MVVAALARKPDDHSARDGQALAPQRLVRTVEISVTRSLARRASEGFARGPRADHSDGPRKLPLGCATNPRRTAHARVQSLPVGRIPLFGDFVPTSRSVVADVYSQSGGRLQLLERSGTRRRGSLATPALLIWSPAHALCESDCETGGRRSAAASIRNILSSRAKDNRASWVPRTERSAQQPSLHDGARPLIGPCESSNRGSRARSAWSYGASSKPRS